MSIKKIYVMSTVLLMFFPHCGKKSSETPPISVATMQPETGKEKLAADYYKMSMLDLEDGGEGEQHYRKALAHIDIAITQERNPLYLAQKATLLFLLGSVDESVRYFNEALALPMAEGVRAEMLNNYACALAKGGDRHRALELFKQLEHDKNYLTPEVALVNQAHIYYEEKKFVTAKEKLLAAINFAPDYLDALYYLGVVCYRAGQYKESLQALDKTIQLESTHEGAIALREKCCEKLMIC